MLLKSILCSILAIQPAFAAPIKHAPNARAVALAEEETEEKAVPEFGEETTKSSNQDSTGAFPAAKETKKEEMTPPSQPSIEIVAPAATGLTPPPEAPPATNVPNPEAVKKETAKESLPEDPEFGTPVEEPTKIPAPLNNPKFFGTSKDEVSDEVILLANRVDRLFGDTRALDEYYDSSLRITQNFFYNKNGTGSYDIQTSMNLSLPNSRRIEERINRWWRSEDTQTGKPVTKKEFKDLNPWEWKQDAGLRFSHPVAYFINARLRKNWLYGPVVNHFYIQAGWDSDRLWEQITNLTSDYAITEKWLFRFWNEGDWNISDETFVSSHGPSWIYNIDKRSVISYDVRLLSVVEGGALYTNAYTIGSTYRTNLHPIDWMWFEVTPQIAWPRSETFKDVWTIFFKLEILIGKTKEKVEI